MSCVNCPCEALTVFHASLEAFERTTGQMCKVFRTPTSAPVIGADSALLRGGSR